MPPGHLGDPGQIVASLSVGSSAADHRTGMGHPAVDVRRGGVENEAQRLIELRVAQPVPSRTLTSSSAAGWRQRLVKCSLPRPTKAARARREGAFPFRPQSCPTRGASDGSRRVVAGPSMSERARTSAPQSGHVVGNGSRTSTANCVWQPKHSPATVSRHSGDAAGRCAPSSSPHRRARGRPPARERRTRSEQQFQNRLQRQRRGRPRWRGGAGSPPHLSSTLFSGGALAGRSQPFRDAPPGSWSAS